jgi:asparagine synthase (glutamine-hydrolysing)
MSGIVGIFHRDNARVERALLHALTECLSYRGPDASGVWCEGSVGLGHAMLRTTHESREERQPASLDDRLWITSDARLDDRAGLIAKLKSSGHRISDGAPDSNLILHSYDTWGANCVDHLRGDFAFAIWDERAKMLFCARDHFGVKPFYYAELADLFLFSNTLNCVRLHPDVSDELNEAAIGDFLLFGLNYDSATTAFREIRRLPPAHSLSISRDGLRMRRYWTPPTDGQIRYHHAEEYIEHFRDLLQTAVTDRLRTDRIGILMSGGLDSTALAATAKELSAGTNGSANIRAFTFVYAPLLADPEGGYAQEVAEFLRIPVKFLRMDKLRLFDRWDDPSLVPPEPVDSPFLAGHCDAYREIAADCRIVLSGEGGDNLMHFEMWPYVRDLWRRRDLRGVAAETARYLWVRRFPWRGIRQRVRGFFGKDPLEPIFPKWFAPDFARRMHLESRWRRGSRLPIPETVHPIHPEACASLDLPEWTRMFELEDAGVTHQAVEVRYPYLDLRMVNYLFALPPFPWFFEKMLVRRAMLGRLPERVRTRRKTALQGDPMLALLRRNGADWIHDLTWTEDVSAYFDPSLLPQLHGSMSLEQVRSSARPLCLNLWMKSMRRVRHRVAAEAGNG